MGRVSNRNEEKPMARQLYYLGYGTKTILLLAVFRTGELTISY